MICAWCAALRKEFCAWTTAKWYGRKERRLAFHGELSRCFQSILLAFSRAGRQRDPGPRLSFSGGASDSTSPRFSRIDVASNRGLWRSLHLLDLSRIGVSPRGRGRAPAGYGRIAILYFHRDGAARLSRSSCGGVAGRKACGGLCVGVGLDDPFRRFQSGGRT